MSLKTQSYLGIIGYFALKFMAMVFVMLAGGDGPIATPVFYAIFFAGTVSLFWGGWAQARMKGYPGIVAIVAILEIIGLIILAVLPDRTPQSAQSGQPVA